jgi:hypothetical protein
MDLLCTHSNHQPLNALVLPERPTVRRWSLSAIKTRNPSEFMRHQYARHAGVQVLAACCDWLVNNGHGIAAAAMCAHLKS